MGKKYSDMLCFWTNCLVLTSHQESAIMCAKFLLVIGFTWSKNCIVPSVWSFETDCFGYLLIWTAQQDHAIMFMCQRPLCWCVLTISEQPSISWAMLIVISWSIHVAHLYGLHRICFDKPVTCQSCELWFRFRQLFQAAFYQMTCSIMVMASVKQNSKHHKLPQVSDAFWVLNMPAKLAANLEVEVESLGMSHGVAVSWQKTFLYTYLQMDAWNALHALDTSKRTGFFHVLKPIADI